MSGNKPDEKLDVLEWVKAAVAFMLVCGVAVLALVGVNAATEAAAARRAAEEREEQLRAVMPGAESFSETWFDHSMAREVLAAFSGSELKGYCVTVTSQGFGGEMELLVGVDVNGRVTGVSILDHSETMEIGGGKWQSFLEQFLGLSGTIRVNGQNNSVDAVSGATKSSQAVADGVNAALAAVANLEGGDIGEEGTV